MGDFSYPFSNAQAYAAGYSHADVRRLVRRGEWAPLRRGVYIPAHVLDEAAHDPPRRHAIDVAGLICALGHRAVAAGTSAAQILGFDLLTTPSSELIVAIDDAHVPHRCRDGYVIRRTELPEHHIIARYGVPLTSAARTIVDLARVGPVTEAVVAADSALHLAETSRNELETMLSDCRGWPGAGQAQIAIRLADPLAESVLESLSRAAMWQEGLPKPRTQVVIGRARVDFFWEHARVIGEADGLSKYERKAGDRSTLDIVRSEKRREERLADAGFEIVRWGWSDACNSARLAARLRAAFARGLARQRDAS